MTKKQKRMLVRIIISFVLFAALMVAEHTGALERINTWILFVIYLVPYLVIGYDIVYKAVRNISHGQVFDENFLMMVATFGAFGVKEYSEAVAVMLFYQVGEGSPYTVALLENTMFFTPWLRATSHSTSVPAMLFQ